MREEERFWFVVWTCKCTDVKRSPEALDKRCPHDDAEAMDGSPFEITPGVSVHHGHICQDGSNWPSESGSTPASTEVRHVE